MTLDKFFRWAFFCAGIITAIFAGYMFYIDNLAGGAVWLAASVGFLSFATRFMPEKQENISQKNNNDTDDNLHDLAVLIADIAAMSLQNIGRTTPPSTKEINDLESKLNKFLDFTPMSESEREEISTKFEAVRNKTRLNQGGRALMRSSRL